MQNIHHTITHHKYTLNYQHNCLLFWHKNSAFYILHSDSTFFDQSPDASSPFYSILHSAFFDQWSDDNSPFHKLVQCMYTVHMHFATYIYRKKKVWPQINLYVMVNFLYLGSENIFSFDKEMGHSKWKKHQLTSLPISINNGLFYVDLDHFWPPWIPGLALKPLVWPL